MEANFPPSPQKLIFTPHWILFAPVWLPNSPLPPSLSSGLLARKENSKYNKNVELLIIIFIIIIIISNFFLPFFFPFKFCAEAAALSAF